MGGLGSKEILPINAEAYVVRRDSNETEYVIPSEYEEVILQLPKKHRDFARDAVASLLKVLETLKGSPSFTAEAEMLQATRAGILRWLKEDVKDTKHGVVHSHFVYMGAVELRNRQIALNKEKIALGEYVDSVGYEAVSDSQLMLYAVLHDLAESLPRFDKDGKFLTHADNPKLETSKDHARAMAVMIMMFADTLRLTTEEAQKISFAIEHHDDTYNHPSEEDMASISEKLSPAGRAFFDADMLLGAAEFGEDVVWESILRGRNFSMGKWYFLRDLSISERKSWVFRTKGYYDGMCALLSEFLGFEPYMAMTDVGRKLGAERKQEFKGKLIKFYAQEYNKGNELMEQWEVWKNKQDDDDGIPPNIRIGVIDYPDAHLKPEDLQRIKKLPFREAMQALIKIPVPENIKQKDRNGRKYFGFSICVNTSNDPSNDKNDVWFDPSILRFDSVEELENALDEAIQGYLGNTIS